MKTTLKKSHILVALGGAGLVLGQLLLPGYILTLDMVFGPQVVWPIEGELRNLIPLLGLRWLLILIFNGWIAQKILLIGVFFLLFYLPLRYFKPIFSLNKTYGAQYVAAALFAINPFVYERLLAGQWLVIAGYALLIPTIVYAIQFCRNRTHLDLVKVFVITIMLSAVSIHFFMIALLILGGVFTASACQQGVTVNFTRKTITLVVLLVIGCSYWIVPAFVNQQSQIEKFGTEHFEAFRTAGDPVLGVTGNVLILHGFWGEHEPWIERFVVPKDQGWLFFVPFTGVLLLVLYGVYQGLRMARWRYVTTLLTATLVLAVAFASGVGEGIFRPFNIWLFENLSFWKGFRDTQKWSGVIALLYALFGGLGAYSLLRLKCVEPWRKVCLVILVSIPFLATPMLLLGALGQLHTTQYPEDWAQVNEVLRQNEGCKVLILPWHQYYALEFNNDLITANVASSYFDCEVVAGKNMELGNVSSQGGFGEEYELVESLVTDNGANSQIILQILKNIDIEYIVYTNDVRSEDPFVYPFLKSEAFAQVYSFDEIWLYRIK